MSARSRVNIHIVQAAILVCLIALTAWGLHPLRKEIDRRIEILKTEAVAFLEAKLGREISYESISPSIFSYIEIKNLSIKKTGTEPLLVMNKVKVYYNIFSIIAGRIPEAFYEVSIEHTRFTFFEKENEDIIALFNTLMRGAGESPELDGISIKLTGKNLNARIVLSGGEYTLDRIFFAFEPKKDQYLFSFRGNAQARFGENVLGLKHIRSSAILTGSVSKDFSFANFNAKLGSIDTNLIAAQAQTFSILFRENKLELRKIQDKLPIDLAAQYSFSDETLTLAFAAERFSPSMFVMLQKELSWLRPWFSSIITGSGNFTWNVRQNVIRYAYVGNALIQNKQLPSALNIETDISGDSKLLDVRSLRVETDLGFFSFQGDIDLTTFYPQGNAEVFNFKMPTGKLLNTAIAVTRKPDALTVRSDDIEYGGVHIYDAAIVLYPRKDSFDFSTEFRFEPDETVSKVRAEGSVALKPALFLQVNAVLPDIPPEKIYAVAVSEKNFDRDLSDLMQQFAVRAEIFVTTDFSQMTVTSPGLRIYEKKNPAHYVNLAIATNNEQLAIRQITVSWDAIQVRGNISGTYSSDFFDFSASFEIQNKPYEFSGFFSLRDRYITVTGSHSLVLSAFLTPLNEVVFKTSVKNFPIPIDDETVSLSFEGKGVFASLQDWNFLIDNAVVGNIPVLPAKPSTASFSAQIKPQSVTFYQVRFKDSVSEVFGNGALRMNLFDPFRAEGWLQLSRPMSGESYTVQADIQKDHISGRIAFNRSPLTRFGKFPIRGMVAGQISVSGALQQPEVSMNLSLQEGFFNADPISLKAQAALGKDKLTITSLQVAYLANTLSDGFGSLNMRTGEFAASTKYKGDVGGPLSLTLSAAGKFDAAQYPLKLEDIAKANFSGTLTLHGIRTGDTPFDPWDFSFRRTNDGFLLNGGRDSSVIASIRKDGEFLLVLKNPLPLQFSASGYLRDTDIEASVDGIVLDLKAFGDLWRMQYFQLEKGVARGSLLIRGPINDPDFFGSLTAENGYASSEPLPNLIGPLNTSIVFEEKMLKIPAIIASSGDGSLEASASVTFDHWFPQDYKVAISIEKGKGIHAVRRFGRLAFDGYALGKLFIEGDMQSATLRGDVRANFASVTIEAPSQQPSPLKLPAVPVQKKGDEFALFADVTVTTGRGVEFFWPSKTLPILRTFCETDKKIRATYASPTEQYTVSGDVSVKGGEIFYFDRNFYVKEGSISFKEDQDVFDPRLTARAEMREIGPEGTVRIYLIADESKFSQFSPRFESDPPMSDLQIFQVLGQGFIAGSTGNDISLSSALLLTSNVLSQFSIMRSFETSVKGLLNLDVFSLRSQILQNLLAEKVFGQNTSSSDVGVSFGRYLDNTSLFLGKYLGNDLFLQMLVRLQSVETLSPQSTAFGDLMVDSEISLEWKTPFFLLKWSFLPEHPENLFLTDNSLSFTWRYSF